MNCLCILEIKPFLFTSFANTFANLWNTVWSFLRKLKIELPCDPAIPFVGKSPDETIIQKDTCTPMFLVALFIVAKTWKQPKCPSADECKKIWCIHTQWNNSHKKE